LQIRHQQDFFKKLLEETMETKFAVSERHAEITSSLTEVARSVADAVRLWEPCITQLVQADFELQSLKIESVCGDIRDCLQKLNSCMEVLDAPEFESCEADLPAEAASALSVLWQSAKQQRHAIMATCNSPTGQTFKKFQTTFRETSFPKRDAVTDRLRQYLDCMATVHFHFLWMLSRSLQQYPGLWRSKMCS